MQPPARAVADDRRLVLPSSSLRRSFLQIIHLPNHGCERDLEAAVMPDGQRMLGVLSGFLSQILTRWRSKVEGV